MGAENRWRRALACAALALQALAPAQAAHDPNNEYWEPLAWRLFQHGVTLGERFATPEEACRYYTSFNPRTPYRLLVNPGWFRCQYLRGDGTDAIGFHEDIYAECTNETPSDPSPFFPRRYSHVRDLYHAPPCFCRAAALDRAHYWCTTETPSCRWYPKNKASGCGKTTDQLKSTMPTSPTAPTRNFHATQTCIAERACNDRCQMENCDWMKAVIPDFLNPYLAKAGNWRAIEVQCEAWRTLPLVKGYGADRLCAREMAMYHIRTDLTAALVKSGCGSDGDWSKVFESVSNCTSKSFGWGFERRFALDSVRKAREKVRATCTAARAAEGLNVAINDNLKGKSCTP